MLKRLCALALASAALGFAACGTDTGAPTASGTSKKGPCAVEPKVEFEPSGIKPVSGARSSLSGAGATFPAPLYSLWSAEYEKTSKVKVAYQSIGSGGGIQQISAQTVDYGASDAPMKSEELSVAKGGPILHIPTVFGAVVATYNLQGITQPLKFDGETLGSVFAGKITKWNDPVIAKLNTGVTLPDQTIVVAHRSDGSGTTSIFTDYLTKVSPTWTSTLGGGDKAKGKEVAWPVGVGGKGNEGVSAAVQQTPGAIGYVELTYAIEQDLPTASILNKAGNYVEPCIATVSASALDTTFPDDLRFSLTDTAGEDAWPISGATWLLVYQNQTDKATAAALVNYLAWIMDTGETLAPSLHYAPLSPKLRDLTIAKIKTISFGGATVAS